MFDDLDPAELLRHDAGWHEAVARLEALRDQHGEQARARLHEAQQRYVNRRPAMIVDAVMSVQQDYEQVVLPLVARFDRTPAARSLGALAALESIDQAMFNNSPKRTETITGVAEGLLRYGRERGLADEEVARHWARVTDGLEFAHEADPYVGSVSGIGAALMGYLRLRSGADSIKIDGRVTSRLRGLGFDLGEKPQPEPRRALISAVLAAQQIGTSLGELDQLLWWPAPRVIDG